jgi:hypothetical protein
MYALRSLVLVAALMAALVAPTSSPQASAAPEATLSDVVASSSTVRRLRRRWR